MSSTHEVPPTKRPKSAPEAARSASPKIWKGLGGSPKGAARGGQKGPPTSHHAKHATPRRTPPRHATLRQTPRPRPQITTGRGAEQGATIEAKKILWGFSSLPNV